jgi:hypothetical protein
MAILLNCPCGRKLQIKEEFAGQEGQCPACGATLMIPYADQPVEVAQVAPVPVIKAPEARVDNDASDQDVRWVPQKRDERGEEVRSHAGLPVPANADFFVDAPPEIGPLTSAYTTLRRGQRPWSMPARVVLCLLTTFGGLLVAAGIDILFELWPGFWSFIWLAALPLAGLLLGLGITGFSHTVTYVGEEGVARYVCSGSRDKLTKQEVFLFRDAAYLRLSTTHHYNKGSYQYTSYKFTWTDVGGRTRYEISGNHNSKNKTPPPTHYYHFGLAAELEWTMYLLGEAKRQIEMDKGVLFPLSGQQTVRILPGRIVFSLNGQDPVEWEAEEVGDAIIHQGTVKIKRVDAQEGWFSSKGVIKFPFESLANAKLFFHLLEKEIGVEVR